MTDEEFKEEQMQRVKDELQAIIAQDADVLSRRRAQIIRDFELQLMDLRGEVRNNPVFRGSKSPGSSDYQSTVEKIYDAYLHYIKAMNDAREESEFAKQVARFINTLEL